MEKSEKGYDPSLKTKEQERRTKRKNPLTGEKPKGLLSLRMRYRRAKEKQPRKTRKGNRLKHISTQLRKKKKGKKKAEPEGKERKLRRKQRVDN